MLDVCLCLGCGAVGGVCEERVEDRGLGAGSGSLCEFGPFV